MTVTFGWLGLGLAVATGCAADRDLDDSELMSRFRAHGVQIESRSAPDPDHRAYTLHVTQPIDHDDPGAGTFAQEVSLLHRSTVSGTPMIVLTTGYTDFVGVGEHELTALLDANQVSIEHRFFGGSIPALDATGARDWSKLTIEQMAADEHAIIETLRDVYDGPYVTAGGSKGGMTATYHRRFYPDDVAGTVAYVAPLSLGAPDARYLAFLATAGPADCHARVHQLAIEMLAHRRAALEAMEAARGQGNPHVPVGAEIEQAVANFEWMFWQYHGVTECAALPALDADDATLFTLLDTVDPIDADTDPGYVALLAAYNFQAAGQLGFPDQVPHDLIPYLMYLDGSYQEAPDGIALPPPDASYFTPTYDPGAMPDIQRFVASADHMLFIYGQWDPWSGGAYAIDGANDAAELVVTDGNHGAQIGALDADGRATALARLAAWTGVAPDPGRLRDRAAMIPRDLPRLHSRLPE
jgi:hypothetical protein